MIQVRDGDLRKLGILFERHHRPLYNFFLRLTSSRELSEDLVQEVFLRMLKYRHTYQGKSEFSFWMFQIARNARIDHSKKRKREVTRERDFDDLVSLDPAPPDHLERDQETSLLRTALEKLALEDREVLLLSRFHEMKYREIARLVGVAEGTIKARVHRAIKNLRDIFYDLSGERPT